MEIYKQFVFSVPGMNTLVTCRFEGGYSHQLLCGFISSREDFLSIERNEFATCLSNFLSFGPCIRFLIVSLCFFMLC